MSFKHFEGTVVSTVVTNSSHIRSLLASSVQIINRDVAVLEPDSDLVLVLVHRTVHYSLCSAAFSHFRSGVFVSSC